jgi:hypothetical protein
MWKCCTWNWRFHQPNHWISGGDPVTLPTKAKNPLDVYELYECACVDAYKYHYIKIYLYICTRDCTILINIVHIFPENCIADTSDTYARCESEGTKRIHMTEVNHALVPMGIPSVVQSISRSRLAGSIPITVSLNEHVYFEKKKYFSW